MGKKMTTRKQKEENEKPWYKDVKWIISTFIGPIFVGLVILYLGNRFSTSLENIKDQLFLKYSNAPQIWGYDPIEYTTDKIFHDFKFDDELSNDRNYSKESDFAVQYLWADPYSYRKSHNLDKINGGYARISANATDENLLRIRFVNTGWGTNVTIRNRHGKSTCVRDFKYLIFKIKSPNKDTVGFRVRIVDFDNVHWAYGKYRRDKLGKIKLDNYGNRLIEYSTTDKDNNKLMSNSKNVKELKIDLGKQNWAHYCFDGVKEINSKIAENPFFMINFIILEVGFDKQYSNLPLQHDMTGFYLHPKKEGIIDITEISFE